MRKKVNKKETILSVLQEIRDLLKNLLKTQVPEKIEISTTSWATIIDDGKKKTSEYLAECRSLFEVYTSYSDQEIDDCCPPPEKPTKTVYKESIEPDLLNLSYDDGIKQNINFMSARERIILELQYFKASGKHLDVIGWTITSTLDRDGYAMHMCWSDDGEFYMFSCSRSDRFSGYGLRQQISKSFNFKL